MASQGAGSTEPLGELCLGQRLVGVEYFAERLGLVDGVEVGALQVLDELLDRSSGPGLVDVRRKGDDCRDPLETGGPGRQKPALAPHEPIAPVAVRAHDADRLQNTVLPDRGGQLLELAGFDADVRADVDQVDPYVLQ